MGEAFNAVKGAMDMFTAFMANQGKKGDQTPPSTGRRDGSISSRIKEFINLDPPEFCRTKNEQDPLAWLKEVQKTLHVMKMLGNDAVELALYRLKDDTTAAAAVSMEYFASVVGYAKSFEEKKHKRRGE
ncbi:hypothetical protein P3S68_012104 [Capsicum galapagoense]